VLSDDLSANNNGYGWRMVRSHLLIMVNDALFGMAGGWSAHIFHISYYSPLKPTLLDKLLSMILVIVTGSITTAYLKYPLLILLVPLN
jgi:hypothetical protein